MSEATAGQGQVASENFILRQLGPADADERFAGWYRDPDVVRYLSTGPKEATVEALRQFIEGHQRAGHLLLGLYPKATDRLIGHTSAYFDRRNKVAGLSVMIGDRDYWGSGVVPETRAVLLDLLFGPGGMEKVKGEVYARNVPALFNYKKLGFQVEGTFRSHAIVDGQRMDLVVFGLLKDEWLARRKGQGA